MNTSLFSCVAPALPQRLPLPYQPEASALRHTLAALGAPAASARVGSTAGTGATAGGAAGLHWPAVVAQATPWVQAVRQHPAPFWALDSLLKEFPLSSAEGLALMRLAEALLRVPDAETAIAFTADQLGQADFSGQASAHAGTQAGAQTSDHAMLAKLSTQAIALAKHFLPEAEGGAGTGAQPGVFKRLGARTVVAATVRAIQLLGRQFVLGRNIAEALREADAQRRHQPASARPLRFSFDMLGEGARTDADAQRYQAAYAHAIATLAERAAHSTALPPEAGPAERDGIYIKLSALHPRYEVAQRERVLAELVPRVWQLVRQAAQADINLTIDAEEVDRLELSLEVLEALAARLAQAHPNWRGFGLAVQAYQTRALAVVAEVVRIAQTHGLRLMVRLVKGAYWDAEIKRAQELGLAHYPVFTQKQHTDASYLACAAALLAQRARVYAQFATTTPAPSPPWPSWPPKQVPSRAPILKCSAGTAWAKAFTARCCASRRASLAPVLAMPCPPAASTPPWASTGICWPTSCAACWKTAPIPPSCINWLMRRWHRRRCWPRPCCKLNKPCTAARWLACRCRRSSMAPSVPTPPAGM